MKDINLSKRLKAAADFVKSDDSILDIGSDHAYLPIYLMQQGEIPSAIAGEVASGPFDKAISQVTAHQLESKIDVRFGDGFEVLKKEDTVGTIFICGMGGLLISEIIKDGLKHDKISTSTRLVLQANNAENELRTLLMENHLEIVAEAIVKENKKVYEIIVAEFTKEKISYSNKELFFGPKLIKEHAPLFVEKWQAQFELNQQILKQLENTNNFEKKQELTKKNHQIKKVIS